MQLSLSEDPAGNEIPVGAMETVPNVRLTMDIGTVDGTMGMDMIGAVNCAEMVGAVASVHVISVSECQQRARSMGDFRLYNR